MAGALGGTQGWTEDSVMKGGGGGGKRGKAMEIITGARDRSRRRRKRDNAMKIEMGRRRSG